MDHGAFHICAKGDIPLIRCVAPRLLAYLAILWRLTPAILLLPVWIFQLASIFNLFHARATAALGAAATPGAAWCRSSQLDFSIFWSAGQLARTGDYATIYDHAAFAAWRTQHLCPTTLSDDWLYLPPALLPSSLISHLPAETGLLVWVAICGLGSAILLRLAGLSWLVILLGLASPAALVCDNLSQLGTITGSLLVAGLCLSDRKPWLAGSLLSWLLLKPQEGLLAPFAVLSQQKYRTFLAAAVGVAGIIVLTTALFGWPVWLDDWQLGRKIVGSTLNSSGQGYENGGVSVFWMLRNLGASLPAAYAGQAFISAIASLLTWIIWRRPELSKIDRVAITVCLSLLATPYGFAADMGAYSIMLACLAEQRRWEVGGLDAVFWLWPLICGIVTIDLGIQLTPFILAAAIARTWYRAANLTTTKPASPAGADTERLA